MNSKPKKKEGLFGISSPLEGGAKRLRKQTWIEKSEIVGLFSSSNLQIMISMVSTLYFHADFILSLSSSFVVISYLGPVFF